jgi:hypothetical protein
VFTDFLASFREAAKERAKSEATFLCGKDFRFFPSSHPQSVEEAEEKK